jgi:hypothetical protein
MGTAARYPKYTAPVIIEQGGKQLLDHMKWGMPGPFNFIH